MNRLGEGPHRLGSSSRVTLDPAACKNTWKSGMTMTAETTAEIHEAHEDTRKILDLSIFWKTLTSQYYEFLSKVVSDPIMKQRFRLMASEERDHRKILRKYRKELVGSSQISLSAEDKKRLKSRFVFLEVKDRSSMDVAIDCILRGEQQSNRFFNQASSRIDKGA